MATYERGQNKQEKVILRTKSPLSGLQRTHTSPLSSPPFRDPIFALCAPLWRCTFCQVNNPTQHTTKKCQRQRQKSPRLKKTWVKESRRNSYDIVKRYRCAQTVLIGFVWTQHFCGFMSQNHSYPLLTQTAEKRTNGTNVGLLFPAFYFSSLGPV